MKKSLVEVMPFRISEITEAEENGIKLMRLKGECQTANERNGNGRIYPLSILEREVKKLGERLASDTVSVYSNVDHPQDGRSSIPGSGAIMTSVSLDPASNKVFGEFKVVKTRVGQDLEAILRAGGKIGISARGFGDSKPGIVNGVRGDVVQENYELNSYDFVIGASHADARVLSVEEQAQQRAQEEAMELSNMTAEQLAVARPDLMAAITAKATEEAKAKSKTELETLVAAETAKLEAKLRGEAEAAKAKSTTEAAKSKDEEDEEDTMEAVSALAKKRGITVEQAKAKLAGKIVAPVQGVAEGKEVETLKRQLTEQADAIKVLNTTLTEFKTDRSKVLIAKRIDEVTKDKPHKRALRERLNDRCASTEDVDRYLKAEEDYIEAILNGGVAASGRGKQTPLEERASGDASAAQKNIKTKSGMVITERQAAMRKMAAMAD